jgi:hypothetical protein
VLTRPGFRRAAWFVTIFWSLGAIGCVVLTVLGVGTLHKATDSRSNSIGLIILTALGVMVCSYLAWACSANTGKRTTYDAEGISGLAIAREHPNYLRRSLERPTYLRDVTRWADIERLELAYNPGAEGGGTFGIKVHLVDGRTGRAYVWSLRRSTVHGDVARLEQVRHHVTAGVPGPPPLGDGSEPAAPGPWIHRVVPHPRASRLATVRKVSIWTVVTVGVITAIALIAAGLAPSPGHHVQPAAAVSGVVILLTCGWLAWYAVRIPPAEPRRVQDTPQPASADRTPRAPT